MNQSVARALKLLDELAEGPKRLGPLAESLGTHKSTVLRLLQTMEESGYVRRHGPGPEFSLGVRILELGARLLESIDVRDVARPHMEELGEASGETVHLAIRDGSNIVYIDKVESRHAVRMYSRIGGRAPLYCTGLGKVILAYTPPERWPDFEMTPFTTETLSNREELAAEVDKIRSRGWATDEREHQDTIRCIAAPILASMGDCIAGISISVPTSRMSARELQRFVPALKHAAQQISLGLGASWDAAGYISDGEAAGAQSPT